MLDFENMERDLELQEYFFNTRPVLDVSNIQVPYVTHKNISIDDPIFSDVLQVRREFAVSFSNITNIVVLSDQPNVVAVTEPNQGGDNLLSESAPQPSPKPAARANKPRNSNPFSNGLLGGLGGLKLATEESVPLKSGPSQNSVPAGEIQPDLDEFPEPIELPKAAAPSSPGLGLNLAGLFGGGMSLSPSPDSGKIAPPSGGSGITKEIKFHKMKKCLQTIKSILQKYAEKSDNSSEVWMLEYKFAPILEIYCNKLIASKSNLPELSAHSHSDFFEAMKLLMGLVISRKLFLTTLSFVDIAVVFGALPEAFIDQFTEVRDLDDFLPVFRLMIEETYKWMLEKTESFSYKTQGEKDSFYEQSIHLMTFFNRLVLYDREKNPEKIEKELLYFELIFTIYHRADCKKLLGKLLEEDTDNQGNKSYNPYFNQLVKDIQKISPRLSAESAKFKLSKESMLQEKGFAFISVVINSMALTSRRYFITETSLYIKRLMPELVEDLLEFTQKGMKEIDAADQEIFEPEQFSDSEESHSELGSDPESGAIGDENHGDSSPRNEDLSEGDQSPRRNIGTTSGFNLDAFKVDPIVQAAQAASEDILEHREVELGIIGNGSQRSGRGGRVTTSKRLNTEERAKETLHIYPGYSEAEDLVRKAKQDKRLENKYYYTLFAPIVELQTNLLFKLEEGFLDNESIQDPAMNPSKSLRSMSIDSKKKLKLNLAGLQNQDGNYWIQTKAKLLRLCQNNLLNICTSSFAERFKNPGERAPALQILANICSQLFTFFRKMDLLRSDPRWRALEIKPTCTVYYLLKELAELLEIQEFHFIDPSEFYSEKDYNMTEILEALIVIQENFELKPELEKFRRSSISCDEQNLDILRRLIQHSNRYNFQPSQKERSYYAAIFAGQVEIEVDPREIYMGLARSYVKILNKMVFGEEFTKYRKLMAFGNDKLKEVGLGFIRETDSEFHPVHRFFISINTSYFYNEMYGRAIVLYEKLIDELPDLRSYIYNEAVKNLSIVNTFAGRKIELIYPFVKNVMDLCLHLSTVVEQSVFHSDSWGTLLSRCFSAQSLLTNMSLNSYSYFKKIFCYSNYTDPKRKDYYESDLSLPFNQLDEIAQFEQTSFSYVTGICMRMQQFMETNHMRSSAKLYRTMNNKFVTTKLIYLTQWLTFISATITDDPRLHEYIYDKLFSRYLLKIVFTYEDNSNIEIVYLKKAILTTLFKLCQSDIVLDKMVKYHVELKQVYDVLIRMAKAHLVSFVDTHALNNPWWKCCSKRKTEESENANEFISHFLRSLKSFTKKSNIRQYKYHPNEYEPDFPKLDMVEICSNIFSGCFYNKDMSKLFDIKSPDSILEKLNIKKVAEIYYKSSSRDLGFQIIHLMIKIITQIEQTTGKRLWKSKKETALAFFDRHIGKLPPSKLHEMKIVYLLSLITRQIEVVSKDKKNKLITFRKYPEIYTLDDDEMLGSLEDTLISDIKREMSKVIARLYLECSVQYTIRNQNYFLYTTFTPKNLRQFPRFVWTIYLALNFVTMLGYVNEDDSGKFKYSSDSYRTAEIILVLLIIFFSVILSSIILFARLRALFIAKDITRYGSVGQTIDPNSNVHNVSIFKKIMENPSVNLFVNAVFERTTINMAMNCILAILGYYINPVYYAAGLLLFVMFSTTMHTLRQAITKNISDIIVTLFLMLMIVLIFTYGQFDYYVNNFTGPFGTGNQPCVSMYTCYLSTLSYGMRHGGGIGEVTEPVVYPQSGYQAKTIFDVGFFFLINMISLNIIFGIIIDTFGQLRDEEAEREDAYRNYCMICGVAKTDFEAEGINFNMHVREQHLINDYMSFMIRLYINRNNLQHDLDYQIYERFTKYNVSWFPNKDTVYVGKFLFKPSQRRRERRTGLPKLEVEFIDRQHAGSIGESHDGTHQVSGGDIPQEKDRPKICYRRHHHAPRQKQKPQQGVPHSQPKHHRP